MQTNSKRGEAEQNGFGANMAPETVTAHGKSQKASQAPATVLEFMRRMGPVRINCDDEIPTLNVVMCSVMLLNSVLERNGNRVLEEFDLTMPQWMALGAISNAGEEGMPHSQLGQRLMLSKAPITGVVDRLERAGFVERKADAKDRRVSRVTITPAGIDKWWAVKESLRTRTAEICEDSLSEEEKQTLLDLLGRLLESFLAAEDSPHGWNPCGSRPEPA